MVTDSTDDPDLFPPEPHPRRRVPAGKAILIMVVTLAITMFIDADGLVRTADRQSLGWERTVALEVMHPIQSVSRALYLNRPRLWLVHATGRTDTVHITSTKGVKIATDKSVPVAGSGTTTTTTLPSYRTPTATDPLRILVLGDSLSGHLGPSLSNALTGKPVDVKLDEEVGTGLARPDVVDWPTELTNNMASFNPDVVVIIVGGNDNQDLRTATGWIPITNYPEWKAEYQRRIAQMLDIAAKPGVSVYWIGLPVMNRPSLEKVVPDVNAMIQAEAAARPTQVTYVDSNTALAGPDGSFQTYAPGPDGKPVQIRENDGVHPTGAGMDRIVGLFVNNLIATRHLAPPPPAPTTSVPTTHPSKTAKDRKTR